MKLYNTLSKQVELIQPQNAPTVTIYTCGPTVYDYPHVGNWFTYIREDILIRILKVSGYEPKWVMNITDVGHLTSDADEGEDKLEKGARREGKTAWEVAQFYTSYFEHGLKKLNILQPDVLPRATDHIAEQIALIQKLETKGYTYTISDGVYYDTSKFPHYADFAKLDLDEQQAGARVEYNREKRNPWDFALWKFSPADHRRDMEWNSPWVMPGSSDETGVGFPGWHVECSAMSMRYLGETLDIHAGGIDHIPVHHTNEIAQSEAATGKLFAHHWMHSNHITIEGDKISKSTGNGITLEDIELKGINLDAFRLHVLESHYRSQSKFSWESLDAAQNRLRNWYAVAVLQWQVMPETLGALPFSLKEVSGNVLKFLENDMDTPGALAYLSTVFSELETGFISTSLSRDFVEMLTHLDALLGTHLAGQADINLDQKQLIARREVSRKQRDWAMSDKIRAELLSQNIALRDTSCGAIWYRVLQ